MATPDIRETCVVFDYDLTLVDLKLDRRIMLEHLLRATRSVGLEGFVNPAEGSFRSYTKIVDRHLRDRGEEGSVRRLLDQAMAAGEYEALGRTILLPGAKEVLDQLNQSGYGIGVVSSNSIRVIRATARRFRIWRFLRAVWGRESPGRAKPAPDKLIGCVRDLGCNRGFYVGDDSSDMVAAAAAGLTGIAVLRFTERLRTLPADELTKHGAKEVLDSLRQLPSLLDSVGLGPEGATFTRIPSQVSASFDGE